MYELALRKWPRRPTAVDMMGNLSEQDTENSVKNIVSYGAHRMQASDQVQGGMPWPFHEDVTPTCVPNGTHPSVYTPPGAHMAGPPTEFRTGNNNHFTISVNPDFHPHPTNNHNIYAGTYQQPVTFNSVSSQRTDLQPTWLHPEDSFPPPQIINSSIPNIRLNQNFQPSQESQNLQSYQYPPSQAVYDAEAIGEQPTPQSTLAMRRKLCNNYHLRGACLVGNSCRYVHGIISQAELRELRRIAKGLVCKFGLKCLDDFCYAGHKCPYNACLGGPSCQFPDEMHYSGPEISRGQKDTKIDQKDENVKNNSLLKYEQHADPGDQPVSKCEEDSSKGSNGHLMRTAQHSVNRERIKREVDELLEDVAPKKAQSESSRNTNTLSGEVTENDLNLFTQNLDRRLQSSQASSPPNQGLGTRSHESTTLATTPQSGSRKATPPSARRASEQILNSSHQNTLKRPRESAPSILKETQDGEVGRDFDGKSPEHRRKRRSKNRSRRKGSVARGSEHARRQEQTSSLQRADIWRPSWTRVGDYWRPGDERRRLSR